MANATKERGMPPKTKKENPGFYPVIDILRGKSTSNPERQTKSIQNAIDYLTSARNYNLYAKGQITIYDVAGSCLEAGKRWNKLASLVTKKCLDEFGLTEENYISPLNDYISDLHKLRHEHESDARKLSDEKKGELEDFLCTYQKALNSGLGNSHLPQLRNR